MESQQLFYATLSEWTPQDEATVLKMHYGDRAALAGKIMCAGLLVDLSLDQHSVVRESVARNPNTPIRTLKRLAEEDLCSSVQESARRTLSALV